MKVITQTLLEVGDFVRSRTTPTTGRIEKITRDGTERPGEQSCWVAGKWRWLAEPTVNDAGQILVSERD